MATGDLKNNIKQLQSELKAAKFLQSVDIEGLVNGSPQTYLAIYHYLFTTYNTQFNDDISNSNNELYGKSDMRFMEAVYKILRDMFDYKPQINREQFFSPGYAERKVIMATDILKLIRRKYKPPKSSTFKVASAREVAKISPREKVQQEPLGSVQERPRKIASKSPPEMAGAIVLPRRPASGGGYKIPKSAVPGLGLPFEETFFGASPVTVKNHREKRIHASNSNDNVQSDESYGASAQHSGPEPVYRSLPIVHQESPDLIVRRKFLDLVSPALLQVNERIGKLEIGLTNLEKKEDPKMKPDLPSSAALTTGLTKQMADVVFKLETLTSRVVLIENRLIMIEATLGGNQTLGKSINNQSPQKTTSDFTQAWTNRNNNNMSSLDKAGVARINEASAVANGDISNMDNVDEGDFDDLKVVVIRKDAQEAQAAKTKMTFIKSLVDKTDLENTVVSDVFSPDSSISSNNYLPTSLQKQAKSNKPQFDDTVSPIKSFPGSSLYGQIQDESLVSLPYAADSSVSKDDRRASTPTHVMLDTSTMDRVSRINQMMAETKQLLH